MKAKRTRIVIFSISFLLVIGTVYSYFAFAWMFFVKPKDGGHHYHEKIQSIAGSSVGKEGFNDGVGEEVEMNKPIRLAKLNDSTIVFADINNHAIRTISNKGVVKTVAGGLHLQGYQDGPADLARFDNPHGVAVRNDGVIAVAEVKNNTIRLLSPVVNEGELTYMVSTLSGVSGKGGMQDGVNSEALFDSPHAVAWGLKGELFVADIGNSRLRMIHNGQTTTIAGSDKSGEADGVLGQGTLNYPMDIAIDDDGNVWIADVGSMTIRRWNEKEGLTTPFPDVEIAMPHGIALLKNQKVVIAEMYGHRILTYDIPSGKVSTICGTTEKGIGANRLAKPAAVLVKDDKIWIADLSNHRIVNVSIPVMN